MKRFPSRTTLLLLGIAIWYSIYRAAPHQITGLDTPTTEFATLRALEHVKNMTRAPHYIGSEAHEDTQNYIIDALKNLELNPHKQQEFSIGKTGNLSHPENIIARIKGTGNGKALLLMAHYDSNPHSAYGASDNASGVATILEGIRAYLDKNIQPQNDIIILLTDGEELGLNGAIAFIEEHPLAKNIGLALNFEARGSGGASFMLIETNGNNGSLVKEFSNAKVPYPVANSLAYSVYKLMPNDTDLTIFRERGDIDGFNFAFIDDHFDYHTANDTWQRLDLNTLQHQGSYLMALLNHFANTDLSTLKSDQDYLYFDVPVFDMLYYPFDWIYPILVIAILLFIAVFTLGILKHRLEIKEVLLGFVPLLLSLFIASGIAFLGWKLLASIYPQYREILHGFPYNGHYYIAVFVSISLAISFLIYARFNRPKLQLNLVVAPLFLWLALSFLLVLYLPGASYLIITVFFGLLALFLGIQQKQPNPYLLVLLLLPAIFVITPFIKDFPIALGLKLLFLSAILTVLLFALLLPVFGRYKRKKILGQLFAIIALGFLIAAHFKSDFNNHRKKPNSLLYLLDTNKKQAYWASYDKLLDPWTSNYIKSAQLSVEKPENMIFYSKYGSQFEQLSKAPLKNIPHPLVEISRDTIIGFSRYLTLCITPQRSINRMDLFLDKAFNFEKLIANGTTVKDFTYKNGNTYNAFTKRWDNRLMTYYSTHNEPLELRIQFPKDSHPKITLFESSYDLLENDNFTIPKRSETMMPKPFVLNDAIVLKTTLRLEKPKDDAIMP